MDTFLDSRTYDYQFQSITFFYDFVKLDNFFHACRPHVMRPPINPCRPPNIYFQHCSCIYSYLYLNYVTAGYTIPAGAEIVIMIQQIHRDPEVFSDPENFNPDNFLPEKISGRFPFHHIPFSAGPRNCIGKYLFIYIYILLPR